MYLLWGTPFMAMIQVLIYTGAIVVLFVFVVMLLNLSPTSMNLSFNIFTIFMIVASAWFVALLLLKSLNQAVVPLTQAVTTFDMKTVSKLLFTKYVWPFEVLSIFLLAMIIAVFTLARPENVEDNL
jgi:NADH-quinone oxidoreductase subunit J